jgi:TolA-binding protein
MTVWIILFWVVGVVVLVAIAVWRGYKNGPTVFKPSSHDSSSDIESVRRDQARAEQRAGEAADRTEEELKLLRSEIQRLNQKLEAQERGSSKKPYPDETLPLDTASAALGELAKGHNLALGELYATALRLRRSHVLGPTAVYPASAALTDLQREIEAFMSEGDRAAGEARKFFFDPQHPKAPMLGLPLITKS